jgi:probable addiction module antidote protein
MTRKINAADLPQFDLAEMLKTEQDIATYLTLVIEEGDVSELSPALGIAARARMTDEQLKARDAGRDIGAELLQSVREMTAGRWTRKTTFEPLADGRVRRTVVRADGTREKQAVLVGPRKAFSS